MYITCLFKNNRTCVGNHKNKYYWFSFIGLFFANSKISGGGGKHGGGNVQIPFFVILILPVFFFVELFDRIPQILPVIYLYTYIRLIEQLMSYSNGNKLIII